MPALSLLDRLAELTDPRDRKGRQYPLVLLVALALVAIPAGNTSVAADRLLGAWLADRHADGWDHIALDGKTVRGNRDGDTPGGMRPGNWRCRRNVVLHHLPPCTPELQPVEPLWPPVREALANKAFPTLAALTEPLEKRCRRLPLGRRTRMITLQRNLV